MFQPPYLDGIRFDHRRRCHPQSLKLQAGEINGVEFIPLSRVVELEADANINMQLFPSTKVNDLLMVTVEPSCPMARPTPG